MVEKEILKHSKDWQKKKKKTVQLQFLCTSVQGLKITDKLT